MQPFNSYSDDDKLHTFADKVSPPFFPADQLQKTMTLLPGFCGLFLLPLHWKDFAIKKETALKMADFLIIALTSELIETQPVSVLFKSIS